MIAAAHWGQRRLSGLLLDLDGTLLDTAADIGLALNRATAEFGWASTPGSEVRRMIGRGAAMLIERAAAAQGLTTDDSTREAVVERFFHHYGRLTELGESSAQPYPGVTTALRTLHGAGLRLAVVTNKQRRFAVELLARLNLQQWLDLIVGGDSCERRKPDPQPLLFACDALQLAPAAVLMVGDSINDVEAARAAGIPVICVPYGYDEGRDPRTLQCDALIDTLAQLPGLLLQP